MQGAQARGLLLELVGEDVEREAEQERSKGRVEDLLPGAAMVVRSFNLDSCIRMLFCLHIAR
jgi:hypothetical protein